MSMVRYREHELPEMTEERKRELLELDSRPDSEIDFSDIPPLDESFWANAVRNPFYRPAQKQASVRIDADVLDWLWSKGRGYQARMNDILREAMLRERANQP